MLKLWFIWNKDHLTHYILFFLHVALKRFLLPLLILDEYLNVICEISFHVELSVSILQYCMTCNLQVYCIGEWSSLHCIHIKADWCVRWMTSVLTCKGKNIIMVGGIAFHSIITFSFARHKERNIQLLYNSQKPILPRYKWSAICCALLDHFESKTRLWAVHELVYFTPPPNDGFKAQCTVLMKKKFGCILERLNLLSSTHGQTHRKDCLFLQAVLTAVSVNDWTGGVL